jgi:serine/threonine protein phosphatase PrpC
MEINSLFIKGEEHKVCQDYALHGTEPYPYLIVCDGSSSSQQSEIGSKLLALSAQKILHEQTEEELLKLTTQEIGNRIIQKAGYVAKQLGLNHETLDATLLLGYLNKNNNKFIVHAFGDGVIIYKKHNDVYYQSINYSENYPYYLSYQLDEERKSNLIKSIQQKMTVSFSKLGYEKTIEQEYSSLKHHTLEIDVNDLEWICLASDGIESFNQDAEKTIQQLSSFKNFRGVFLERRVNKLIKENKKNNITHYDDLSVAGIFFGENNEYI